MSMHPSFQALGVKVLETYPKLHSGRLRAELDRISYLATDTRQLIGKRILDLGCGSVANTDRPWNPITRWIQQYKDPHRYVQFHPWYCRILEEAEAEAVGIDIGPNRGEKFESHKRDLLKPDIALRDLPDESIEHANNYFLSVPRESNHAQSGTSPGIMRALSWKNRSVDAKAAMDLNLPFGEWRQFFDKENLERMWAINDQIFAQVERVLKEGGVYTLAEFVYRKQKGKLKMERTMEGFA